MNSLDCPRDFKCSRTSSAFLKLAAFRASLPFTDKFFKHVCMSLYHALGILIPVTRLRSERSSMRRSISSSEGAPAGRSPRFLRPRLPQRSQHSAAAKVFFMKVLIHSQGEISRKAHGPARFSGGLSFRHGLDGLCDFWSKCALTQKRL